MGFSTKQRSHQFYIIQQQQQQHENHFVLRFFSFFSSLSLLFFFFKPRGNQRHGRDGDDAEERATETSGSATRGLRLGLS